MGIEGQGNFLTLAQGHLHMKIKTGFSQKPVNHFETILYVSFKVQLKFNDMIADHMTKMATMPINVKNPSKIFSRTIGQISTKLGM